TYQGRSADIYFDWRRERLVPKVRGKLKDFGPPTWSLRKLPTADVVNFMNVMSLFIRGPNRYRDLPLLQRSGSSLSYYGVGCDEVSLMRVRPDAAELPCASCEALDALGQQCRERILGLREAARAASDHVEFVVSSAYEYSHCREFFE